MHGVKQDVNRNISEIGCIRRTQNIEPKFKLNFRFCFYTPTEYGTIIQEGGFFIRLNPENPKGEPLVVSKQKPTVSFNGINYVLEESITGDYSFFKAYKGNIVFRKQQEILIKIW